MPAGVGAETATEVPAAAPPSANTLTVTSTGDSGASSLRQALADAAPGDTINFNLPPDSTIMLSSGELVRAGSVEWDIPIEIHLYRSRARQSAAAERFWSHIGG